MDIVRNGEKEATNYFFSLGDANIVLELTLNHDGRTYDLGTGYGHIAIGVDDLDGTLARLGEQGIEPERAPYQVREGGSLLCFVRDPDGYRIEIIGTRLMPASRRTSRSCAASISAETGASRWDRCETTARGPRPSGVRTYLQSGNVRPRVHALGDEARARRSSGNSPTGSAFCRRRARANGRTDARAILALDPLARCRLRPRPYIS